MTGYTVNTGSNEEFAMGWDRVFQAKKSASKSAKKATKSAPPKRFTGKKPGKKPR